MRKLTIKIGNQNSKGKFEEMHYMNSNVDQSAFKLGVCSKMLDELKLQLVIQKTCSVMLVEIIKRYIKRPRVFSISKIKTIEI